MSDENLDNVLGLVDPARRAALRSMVIKTAFVAPVVATFAMGGLSVHEAHAYSSNIRLT